LIGKTDDLTGQHYACLARFFRCAFVRAALRSTSFFGTWISAFITLSNRGKGESELDWLSFDMVQPYAFSRRA